MFFFMHGVEGWGKPCHIASFRLGVWLALAVLIIRYLFISGVAVGMFLLKHSLSVKILPRKVLPNMDAIAELKGKWPLLARASTLSLMVI